MNMKGQYFSFDAVIATVIMVLAFSSLVAYWHGAQTVVEERNSNRLADAYRMAESLLSPGAPGNWEDGAIGNVRQLGISRGYGNELDEGKVDALVAFSQDDYEGTGRLLRAGGDYRIVIEYTMPMMAPVAEIGGNFPENADYVVVANRGITYKGKPGRMRVFLWKQ
ncbi:MAG: hypothetical protein WC717_03775 [Candidatus Micrarchaeia archaeon]|jgi:hypothetical protein